MWANNAKAMSVQAKTIKLTKPREVKPTMQRVAATGSIHLLTSPTPRPGQHTHAAHARSPGVWGSAGQSLGPGLRSRSKLHYSSGPVPAPVQDQEGAQASAQAPEERPLSAGVTVQDQRDPGLLSAWGCVLLGVL